MMTEGLPLPWPVSSLQVTAAEGVAMIKQG